MGMVQAIRATIHLTPTAEGGRKQSIRSGYRPDYAFAGDATSTYGGKMVLEDRAVCAPGQTCTVRIELAHPEYVGALVSVGDGFEIREGMRVVARGTILQLLHQLRTADA